MTTDIPMPQLGESVTEGTIVQWLKEPGDYVAKYDPLCEVATDKVNAEVPASISGRLTEVVIEEGKTVAVGEIICRIQAEEKADAGRAAPVATPGMAKAPQKVEGKEEDRSMKRRYSPAVLRLAQENDIDLEQVEGTGKGGRITRKDLLKWMESRETGVSQHRREKRETVMQPPAQERPYSPPTAGEPEAPLSKESEDREIPLTHLRKTIAQRMVTSKQEAPHAWMMVQADVTGLVKLRQKMKKEFVKREGIPLTYLPFFIKAVVDSLKEFPHLNSVWGKDRIILKKRINISIAVATEDALYVPVIHDADEKSILGLAKAIHQLAKKTRAGQLTLEDLSGGTFTVNNTGSFGSIASQPIINHPQAAILSMESIVKQPVIKNEMIAVRDLVNLCLSLDHRILDGWVAGRFLQQMKEHLEAYNPDTRI